MPDYLDADEAAEFLGVQRSTLYAYVSRGLLESVAASGDARQKRYRRRDLVRLKRKKEARSGEGPAAASALTWGAPTIETRVSELGPRGPSYRGRDLRRLVDQQISFEAVAEWLWRGELPEEQPKWRFSGRFERAAFDRPGKVHPLEELLTAVQQARLDDPRTYSPGEKAALECARQLIKGSILESGCTFRGSRQEPDADDWTVAKCVAWALELGEDASTLTLLDRTLVVVAEHGLNASTFAGRVAASTGADLYACVLASLAAFSGPRHGLQSERVRAILRTVEGPDRAEEYVRDELRRGRALPGFGHPMYEHGDLRFELLRTAVDNHGEGDEILAVVDAIARAASRAELQPPNLDLGICAVTETLDIPVGGGAFLFAVGRMAGWIAHALEQRERDHLLRPRSTYTGQAPT